MQASEIGKQDGFERDRQGRILVQKDLSVASHPDVFAAGDLCSFTDKNDRPLPGIAPVATQQGRHFAKVIRCDLDLNQAKLD